MFSAPVFGSVLPVLSVILFAVCLSFLLYDYTHTKIILLLTDAVYVVIPSRCCDTVASRWLQKHGSVKSPMTTS